MRCYRIVNQNNLDIGNKEFLKNLFYKTDSINFDTFEIARLKNRAEGRSRRDEYRGASRRTTVT